MLAKIIKWFEIVGTAKAAAELSRQGYYAEANKLMSDIK